ncbi:hypothetical protein EV138_5152 [Kribbella voronezhensis]|uniref:Secretory lipase n=1 Tax=Kribbella voronezhensis TaxID=2512212 RepID=A0A4R7TH23_9ACTN|nr:hypothetical protein [Kribbella voronezhensis]TDU91544.1 hypothetical protein EV138_5152 [Kribbella voronezhensis]
MTQRLTKLLAFSLAATAVVVPTAAVAAPVHQTPADQQMPSTRVASTRGSIVSAVRVARLTPAQLHQLAITSGFVDPPNPRYAVSLYRLVYRTVDHFGRPTTASGLVVLPEGRRGALRVAAYLHGTSTTKADAATIDPHSTDRAAIAMFAGAGMAGIAPDYLGLGLGPGRPPYLDLTSEKTSSVDLLRAASGFAVRHGVVFRKDVAVTGFSQGGRATLAFGRALQSGAAGSFRLGALAPVAGPYDILGTEFPAVFNGQVDGAAAAGYLAYLVTAWKSTIGLYDDPEKVFQPQYAQIVEGLLDGTHPFEEIAGKLPDSPDKLFLPAFLAELKHPTGIFARTLREGDRICTDWTPRVPVTMYTGTLDRDVVPANADSCAAALRSRGAHVTIRSMGPVNHSGTALAAYPEIVRAFAG